MRVLSWVTLLLALTGLAYVAVALPIAQRTFLRLFADLKLKIPAATEIALSIPDWVFIAFAVTMALVSIVLQWRFRGQGNVALFHAFIVVLCWLTMAAYHELMFQAMMDLVRGLSK